MAIELQIFTFFHDLLERPVRLVGSPDSVATRRVAGTTQRLSDRRETPLWGRPTVFVAQTRWGNPQGHMPGVRFATREPAADACTFYGSDGCCWNAEW